MPEPIDTPQTRKLANELVRPLAEQLLMLVGNLEFAQPAVDNVLPLIPNDDTIIIDGREPEGISPMTGAMIHAMADLRTAVLAMKTPEVTNLLGSVAVRTPRVTISG